MDLHSRKKSFEETFGRPYGLMEPYQLEDAELCIVSLGSTAGTVKDVVDARRAGGARVGSLKLRAFRPFPAQEIAEAISGCKAVAVLDRSISFGADAAPLFGEVTSALYVHGQQVPVAGYVYGLGGREIRPEHIESVYGDLKDVAAAGATSAEPRYLGLRD